MTIPNLFVSPLSEADVEGVGAFDCGSDPWDAGLNEFLHDEALADQQKGLNRTYLFYDETQNCLAFATLSAAAIPIQKSRLRGLLPRSDVQYPAVPAVLIGRIAVDGSWQRQGIGRYVMAWVRNLTRRLPIGCRFLAVDVEEKNGDAIRFYEGEGFFAPPGLKPRSGLRLMLYDLVD